MAELTVTPNNNPAYLFVKRSIDIAVSLLCLIVLSPLFLLVALAIKLTSKGPVLFTNTVVGKGCQPFTYYKFRSMKTEMSDSGHREFIGRYVSGEGDSDSGASEFKFVNDPRITPVGRIIRKLSIDEFPQMINVLKGDMSLVGPRPPVLYEYELYDDRKKLRLLVRPGITGYNQVTSRGESSFEEMFEQDIWYMEHRNIWLDLWIILKTPFVMLFGKGAA